MRFLSFGCGRVCREYALLWANSFIYVRFIGENLTRVKKTSSYDKW